MKNRTKTVFRSVERVIDADTSEILDESEVHIKVPVRSFEHFCLVFGDQLRRLLPMDGAEVKVFLYVSVKRADMDTNEFSLNKTVKEEIQEYTIEKDEAGAVVKKGLSMGAINNAISGLVKKNIFLRRSHASYYVNPEFAFKGKLSERANAMENITLKVDYIFPGHEPKPKKKTADATV